MSFAQQERLLLVFVSKQMDMQMVADFSVPPCHHFLIHLKSAHLLQEQEI
jgi:hypothetical protein